MTQRYQNFIGGEWTDARTGQTYNRFSPNNREEAVGTFQKSGPDDLKDAIAAAAAAFPGWSRTTPVARGQILLQAGQLLRQRADSIALDLSWEEGKALPEARGEVIRAAQVFEYYAGEGARLGGETLPSSRPGVFLFTLREPLGVVGLITPWNFPIAIPAWKMAPALVCGNSVVFKPASATPLTATRLVQALCDAGLPPGVLNLVTGPGGALGETLATDPAVKAISFTGSNAVGRELGRMASSRNIRVQLELGGKNPLIVLADADLDKAVDVALDGVFMSTGQKCTATGRIYVERSVAGEFTSRLTARVRRLRVGDARAEGTVIGPVVDEGQMQSVLEYVAAGREAGATLVCGGGRLTGAAYERGFYLEPVIFTDVTQDMKIAREEIFGPVAVIIPVDSFEQAIALANDTAYGLSASICTTSLQKAMRFAREIEAGVVGVNLPTAGVEYQAPFGGTKASGSAYKEQGKAAVDFYTHIKTVAVQS